MKNYQHNFMNNYQHNFIRFAISCGVLRFDQFRLKSGRISPYFFNAAGFSTGNRIIRYASFYAYTVENSDLNFDLIYGPAYKGIPLATALSMRLYQHYKRNCGWAFNRKETKDHGEGGNIVGSAVDGKNVLIIDDVLTSGTAVRESITHLRNHGATCVGIVISFDRQERGNGRLSAIQEIEQEFSCRVISIAGLEHLTDYLEREGQKDPRTRNRLQNIREYQQEYGIHDRIEQPEHNPVTPSHLLTFKPPFSTAPTVRQELTIH